MEELLLKLNRENIDIALKDGELELSIPQGTDASALIPEIKAHKQDLIAHLLATDVNQHFREIPVAEVKPNYVLSSAQRRLYFIYEYDKESIAYNMPRTIILRGKLDRNRLEKAFNTLVSRHESLRTSFEMDGGQVVQVISNSQSITIPVHEIPTNSIDDVIDGFVRPFDLTSAPLFRFMLLKANEELHYLLLDIHHIVCDGVSFGILIRELLQLYKGQMLPKPRLQYKDFTTWQQGEKQHQKLITEKRFWLNEFSEETHILNLPTDFNRPKHKSHRGAEFEFSLETKVTVALRELGEASNATFFMTILAVLNVLLSKLGNQEDITIGSPVSGREHADLGRMIGMFVNTLVLRNFPKGNLEFEAFLSEVRDRSLACFDHQTFPYEELIESLGLERDPGHNPLFDVMYTYQKMGRQMDPNQPSDFSMEFYNREQVVSKFDLIFNAQDNGDSLSINVNYSTDLFAETTIKRFASYFVKIASLISENSKIKLCEIDILPESEHYQLLHEFNHSIPSVPPKKTVIDLFHDQVSSTPNQAALILNDQKLSYHVLNSQSDQLAGYLRNLGIVRGDKIGLMLDRSVEMIVAIVAILKTGAAYVPVDPDYPDQRINYILLDSSATLLITSHDHLRRISFLKKISVEDGLVSKSEKSSFDVDYYPNSEDLGYIIYTSGTTGNPKGVMVPHKAIVNLIQAQRQQFGITSKERILQFSNVSFDASVEQIWLALLTGATLVLVDNRTMLDASSFNGYLRRHGVTHLHATPSFLASLQLDQYLSLKRIISGGEACSAQLADRFVRSYDFYNEYGPTETTVTSTIYKYNKNLSPNNPTVPIGRPLPNTSAYVLDKYLNLSPVGAEGELYLGGLGVTNGYIGNPDLTDEKFIASPFRNEKLYKTGDLVRWSPDGNLEFIGRLDDQVKIRGYRIELREIAYRLKSHENIEEAVVLAKEKGGKSYLVGYYVSRLEIDESGLRDFLANHLPDYMIPSYLIHLHGFPLTANGKLDKKALPDPKLITEAEYLEPANDTEQRLVAIWSEVLSVDEESISVEASFFKLGGHSLSAMTMANKIAEIFNVQISVREVFFHKDVRNLARFITKAKPTDHTIIELAKEKSRYLASSAQNRLYFLFTYDPSSLAYNMPQAMEMDVAVNEEILETVFKQLIARHEILRTQFELVDGEVFQKVTEGTEFKMERFKAREEEVKVIFDNFIRPFDLNNELLIRVGLIRLDNSYVLMLDMHHIITDGVSQGILMKEFMMLYSDSSLQKPYLQYRDYAEWQQSDARQTIISKQLEYWQNQFVEEVEVLELPTDYVRSSARKNRGDSIRFSLSEADTRGLRWVSTKSGSTMFMTVFSLFNVLLSKLSNQEDVTIGTPVAGRNHSDLHQMVGLFVNTLVIRSYPKGSLTFEEFLIRVKEKVLTAFEHQDVQYEDLISQLDLVRDTSHNPLFDVMFTFQNFEQETFALPGLTLKPVSRGVEVSKFDLLLNGTEVGDQLLFNLSYDTALFKRSTIERFIAYFKRIINDVIKDPAIELSEIEIISTREQQHLLKDFNDTVSEYPRDRTLTDLFEFQAQQTPDQIALIFEQEQLTYSELDHQSSKMARYLAHVGVQTGSVVSILLDRSMEMIISMVAVLKSGATYLPLAVDQPESRIKYMLQDSGSSCLITGADNEKYKDLVKVIDVNGAEEFNEETIRDDEESDVNQAAYIIYTSGSSGQPKGVAIAQRSVVNLVFWHKETLGIGEDDKILQFSSLTFDASVKQIWSALLSGASLVLISKEKLLDKALFNQYLIDKEVTYVNATPSFLINNEINADNRCVKHVIVGGEQCPEELVNRYKGRYKLYNAYGPTETCINSVHYQFQEEDQDFGQIPIGRPIHNTQILILDRYGKLQPPGVKGEICIAGEGLAIGYINRKELTSEKFLKSPYLNGERLYKTGDLGRWLPDKNLAYLGRLDNQVKIRGFRIELGEIESALMQHQEITEVVILVREFMSDKQLVAYYTSKKQMAGTELNQFLAATLSDYMIPRFYVHIDQMPLTSSGKVDRRKLPEPKMELDESHVAPSNEIEEKLVGIWAEVLKVPVGTISVAANFFEIGGHSLKAMDLVNKISKKLEVEVPVKEVFSSQSIRSLSSFIKKLDPKDFEGLKIAESKSYYPTSSAQRRMYFLYELDETSLAYNMPQVIELDRSVDVDQLTRAFVQLVERHEGLRTTFKVINGEIFQRINTSNDLLVEKYGGNATDRQSIINSFIRPFDLNNGPLIRVGLSVNKEGRQLLMVDMHHIISDGLSNQILVRDFMSLYQGEKLGKLKLQYKDYAEWQHSKEQQARLSIQKAFWRNEFQEGISVLDLPTDFKRPVVKSFEGDRVLFALDEKQITGLRKISRELGATMFLTGLTVFNVLLSKLANQEDIIVGTPTSGRNHEDLSEMVGMFVNTLAVRNRLRRTMTFVDFLKEVKSKVLTCFDNQSFQYEELIEELDLPRDTSRNPLFDVMFTYNKVEATPLRLSGMELKSYGVGPAIAKFDLLLSGIDSGDHIQFTLNYAKDLFRKSTAERFVAAFQQIVNQIASDPNMTLANIDVITPKDRQEILEVFNDTKTDFPEDLTVIELFEAQVRKTPKHIALVDIGKSFTYEDLNKQVNQLAYELTHIGIKSGNIVALFFDRSPEMIISILATLKAGATYLPVSPDQPEERTDFILEDSGADLLLVQRGLNAHSDSVKKYIYDPQKIAENPTVNPHHRGRGSSPAYIIYTSGTTGRPKGTAIMHSSVNRLVKNTSYIQFTTDDNVLQLSNYAFDGSVFDIFGSLLNGATLVLLSKEVANNLDDLGKAIQHHQISVFFVTTALFNVLVDEKLTSLKHVRKILFGGEQVSFNHVKKAFHHLGKDRLLHCYGPTESTVFATCFPVNEIHDQLETIPIGRPLSNTSVYIVDELYNLLPKGVPGQLCIGGAGLAIGYLANEPLTKEKFIDNPFAAGELMYLTGDTARWLEDGNIEFLGRNDDQVKIRGYRIELNEISFQLLKHEAVLDAIVVALERAGVRLLVAYYIASRQITPDELRSFISGRLPDYMLPSSFIQLDHFPLTPNGKVNKKELPEPDLTKDLRYVAPANELEVQLVQVWANVLKLDVATLSVTSNFFELGGDSLRAMLLVNQTSNVLKLDLSIREVFTYQEIRLLAENIKVTDRAQSLRRLRPVDKQSYYRTSSAQRRMYFLHELDNKSLAYNMPQFVRIEGQVDIKALENAFLNLIKRHESLRTSFQVIGEEVVQIVNERVTFELPYEILSENTIEQKRIEFVRPFDLGSAPLLRAALFQIPEKDQVLMVDMHHIVSDGFSKGILIRDFMRLYSGESLSAPKFQYKDYAEWQREEERSAKWRRHRAFWHSEFQADLNVLELPYDFSRNNLENHEGNHYTFQIDQNLAVGLKALCESTGATMFMANLAIFNILLSKLSNQEDIVIGTPVSGRDHPDLEDMIGMFVNTIALRNNPKGDLAFDAFFSQIKDNVLSCLEH